VSINLSIKQKGLLLVLLPVGSMIVFALILYLVLAGEIERYKVFQGNRRLIYTLQRAHSACSRAVFAMSFTSREGDSRLRVVEKLENQVLSEKDWEKLDQGLEISPEFRDLVKDGVAIRQTTLALIGELKNAATDTKNSRRMYQMAFTVAPAGADAKRFFGKLMEFRTRLDNENADGAREREFLISLILWGTGLSVLLSVVAVWFFSREIVQRLNATARTTQLMAMGQTVTPPASRADELGALEKVIYNATTVLNQARARESAVLNNSSHLILSLDARLRIAVVGDSCLRLWKYSSDTLIGNSILTFVRKELVDETRAAFESASAAGQGEVETQIVLSDGTFRDTVWTVKWSAKEQTFYCVVRDVTELRRVEKLRQYFLSMAGHDLRSPLTAIGMNLSLISEGARGPVPDALAAELSSMEATLNGLIEFVNQLLDLEKLESVKGALNLGPVNAGDLCESAIERLASDCESRKVRLGSPAGAALVLADEDKLEKAVFNLIGSAVKLAPPGAVLGLSVSRDGGMGRIAVTVPDLTMPPESSERLFDKLRMTAPSQSGNENVGLGLAIVKAIVDMHEGAVGLESASGITTFWLSVTIFEEDTSA